MDSSNKLIISIANNPAFWPPLIATVATGIPAGIWTIDKRESIPLSALLSTGTPITGMQVMDASIPGRWAAPPAPAIITFIFSDSAFFAYYIISIGVRWAESIQNSVFIPNSLNRSIAGFNVFRSESLPITTAIL